MDILLKINQGTGKLTDKSLCLTCRDGKITETTKDLIVECHYSGNPQPVTQIVHRCSGYYNRTLPTKRDYEQIAWTIDVNKRQAGFTTDVIIKAPEKKDDDY